MIKGGRWGGIMNGLGSNSSLALLLLIYWTAPIYYNYYYHAPLLL